MLRIAAGQSDLGDDRMARSPGLMVAIVASAMLLLAMLFIASSFQAVSAIDRRGIDAERLRAAAALEDARPTGFGPDEISQLAKRFAFKGGRVGSLADIRPDEVSVPLPSPGTSAQFIWTPDRLGSTIFVGTSLFRYCVACVVFLLVGFIFLRFHRLARALEAGRQTARDLASRDSLTGLPNRLSFEQRFDAALKDAKGRSQSLALLYLDLDDFKLINDTMGHAAGDLVLKSVAERLRQVCAPDDTIARLGGDEFAIVHPMTADAPALAEFAAGLRAVLSLPYDLDGRSGRIGASVGIAVWPEHGAQTGELLQRADKALYRAKANPELPFVMFGVEPAPASTSGGRVQDVA